jgi:hypothetical protein
MKCKRKVMTNLTLISGSLIPRRAKQRPRGKPFEKGNKLGFRKGESANPGGKPKVHQRIGAQYAAKSVEPAPREVIQAIGLKKNSTWLDAIAIGMLRRAAEGDVSAAREIREVTEGRVPAALNLEGKIDYSAGQTAKQQLMKMLGEPER